ncbi:MAG: hypothetical protein P4M09_30150 [Devosia sp.]|nr:hypothetical protein [Devosia sp.]
MSRPLFVSGPLYNPDGLRQGLRQQLPAVAVPTTAPDGRLADCIARHKAALLAAEADPIAELRRQLADLLDRDTGAAPQEE